MDHVENCAALDVEVSRFAEVMSSMALGTEIPTCPGWTVADLAEHLGVIHRWAEELVSVRSTERIARVPLENHDVVSPEWITAGGKALVATLLLADPDDEMWAWGLDQHVRFWSRRQLHETTVHRMDLELALQREPKVDAALALDAIDEYLSNIEKVGAHSPELAHLRGHGEHLAFRDSDSGTLWGITLDEDGFRVSKEPDVFDAELVASPVDLLLVVLGRREMERVGVEVIGDRQLIEFWLTNSSFD